MEILALVLVFAFTAFVLLAIFSSIKRGTFISTLGLFLILTSPIASSAIASGTSSFEVWTATFRTLGVCVFVWGVVENVLLAWHVKGESPKIAPSPRAEETISQ